MTAYKYSPVLSSRFKKDVKRLKSRHWDLTPLYEAIDLLAQGKKLPAKYRDHALIGELTGWRDCHIAPDWILLYAILDDELLLDLHRTGTHQDTGLE